MFDYTSCYADVLQTPEALRAQVELMLPTSTSVKYRAEEEAKQDRLVEVALEYGIQWFPSPQYLLLVRKKTNQDHLKKCQLPPMLVTFWKQVAPAFGQTTTVFTAKVEYEKGARMLLPLEFSLFADKEELSCIPWDNLSQFEQFADQNPGDEAALAAFVEDVLAFEDEGIYFDEAGTWWMAWVHRELSKLPPAVMVEVLCLFRPNLKPMGHGKDVGVSIKARMLEYQFWFNSRTVLSNTGTSQTLMESCSIGGQGYPTLPLFFTLCIMLGSPRWTGSIPATLNEIPNAWQRDEGSYGCTPEWDHPTGVANSDMRLPLAGVYRNYEKRGMCLTSYPWVMPVNGKFTPDLLRQVIDHEGASAPDKYNMKSATGTLGAMALGVWMGKNKRGIRVVHNFHDSGKLNKLLNRPTQARLFNFLEGEILREGEAPVGREQSGMKNTIQYKPESEADTPLEDMLS